MSLNTVYKCAYPADSGYQAAEPYKCKKDQETLAISQELLINSSMNFQRIFHAPKWSAWYKISSLCMKWCGHNACLSPTARLVTKSDCTRRL